MPNNYRELTQKVIEVIADEMDIPAHLILSKARSEEIVGARHMAIMILCRHCADDVKPIIHLAIWQRNKPK